MLCRCRLFRAVYPLVLVLFLQLEQELDLSAFRKVDLEFRREYDYKELLPFRWLSVSFLINSDPMDFLLELDYTMKHQHETMDGMYSTFSQTSVGVQISISCTYKYMVRFR